MRRLCTSLEVRSGGGLLACDDELLTATRQWVGGRAVAVAAVVVAAVRTRIAAVHARFLRAPTSGGVILVEVVPALLRVAVSLDAGVAHIRAPTGGIGIARWMACVEPAN